METTTSAESLWLNEPAPHTTYDPLAGEVRADLAVIGGGIAGATLALAAQSRGARVVLVEAATVGSGVTGATTAKVTALQGAIFSEIAKRHDVDAVGDYVAASLTAVHDVAQRVAAHQIDCDLELRPAVTYTSDPAQLGKLRAEFELAQTAGLPVEWNDHDAGLAFDVAGAIWLANQIGLQPVRYVRGLVDAFARAGGRVFERSRVMAVRDGKPCRLETAHGVIHADQVALCTHFPTLDRGLLFARMEAQRSYCVALGIERAEALPRAMAIGVGENDRSVQWFADNLIIGGEGHPAGAKPATAAPARYEALEAWGARHWPTAPVRARWSAQDPVPYDRLPMIGPLFPGSRRIWVATGWAKWGLTGGTFAARILSDAIDGRADEWRGRFSPSRLSLRSAPEIAKLGASFQAHMIIDRVTAAEVDSPAAIPVGEARVLRRGRSKLGVYRDSEGQNHAVSLRCTHLGCLCRFNAAEVSWDCPCHGSRFDVDGAVLEGPAVAPLRRYDLD